MYFVIVILLMLVLPVASIVAEAIRFPHAHEPVFLIAKWFVFWAVGVRLFLAGIRQVLQPRFTAEEIFNIRDSSSFSIVRELGFANLSMGLLAIGTILEPSWTIPAATVGGLYYGLAGAGHIAHKSRNAKENVAMISDVLIFLLLLFCVLRSLP